MISRLRAARTRAATVLVFALLFLTAASVPGAAIFRMFDHASPVAAAASPRWDCPTDATPSARVAFKAAGFGGNLAGLASVPPDGALFFVVSDTRARLWRLFLYPGDLVLTYRWDYATVELYPPSGFPTGKIDPVGQSSAIYHDGRIKLFYQQWPGDSGGDTSLMRVDFACSFH